MTDTRKLDRDESLELEFLEGVYHRISDDYQILSALGELYTRAGRYEEGLAIDEKLASLAPDDELVWYNLACSQSLLGMNAAAILTLQQAIDLGYDDGGWMRSDKDLNGLRNEPGFKELLLRLGI